MHFLVVIFLILAVVFAWTHQIAMVGFFYWHFWWFDIIMHFWGGILLGLGVHAFSTFNKLPKLLPVYFAPTLGWVLATVTIAVFSWEAFEWAVGLYDPATHLADTIQDILLGYGGGLLAHYLARPYTMRNI